MNNGRTSSGNVSVKPSPSAPETKPPRRESDYLAQQAEDAKQAATRALHDLRKHAIETVDVRGWTKRYPLPAIGVAAAGGFVTTWLAKRSRHGKVNSVPQEAKRHEAPSPPPARKDRSWMTTLVWASMDLLKSAIVASLKTAATSSSNVNGKHDNATTDPRSH
jgi:hypothetical protein